MAYIDWWNRTGPVTLGERFGLNGIKRVALAKGTPGGWWGDWELNYKDQMTFEEYKKALDIDKNPSGLEKAEGGRIDMKPGGIVEPGVTNYGKTATSRKYIEKGIYRRDNGNYRLVANREGAKKLDKTLPKGSTLEDARKALSAWEKANPIKVKWKEGQKIKIITEGPKGKQVNVDICECSIFLSPYQTRPTTFFCMWKPTFINYHPSKSLF